jgi:hypothetical protein
VRAGEAAWEALANYSPFACGHIARGPFAKSVVVNDGVAASLGYLVPVVHDTAITRATGGALVQIALRSNPDEHKAGAAIRALHLWCEQV